MTTKTYRDTAPLRPIDLLVRVLLKAVLYAFLLALLPVLLDMHYDYAKPASVCMGNAGHPGRWDCATARQLGPAEVPVLYRIGSVVIGKIEHRR